VVTVHSGVFRIWQRRGHGERAEREPITEVWGGAPSRVQGQGRWSGVRGASPPGAETLFASECLVEFANSPIFLKFGNAKDHQTLLNFAILAGKWQKTHLSRLEKIFMVQPKGAIAPWLSP